MSILASFPQQHKNDLMHHSTNGFSPPFFKSGTLVPSTKAEPQPTPSAIGVNGVATIDMTTPHRGLPPPVGMTLPDPSRTSTLPSSHALGHMPAPPDQWYGQADAMRNWLMAKAEEDKRRQEEEKTKQEEFRLEQRKIEQAMLREAIHAQVPPQLIPMIYAGIGGSNLANLSLDLLQQYAVQLQTAQQQLSQQGQYQALQQQQQTTPEMPKESGRITYPSGVQYGGQPSTPVQPSQSHHHSGSGPIPSQMIVPSQPVAPLHPVEPVQHIGPYQHVFSANQPSGSDHGPPRSIPRSDLPRLTAGEMYVHHSSPQQIARAGMMSNATGPGGPYDQQHGTSSINFLHWQPPNETKSTRPETPSTRNEPGPIPLSTSTSDPEYRDSPRKRKAVGSHTAGPATTSLHGSPSYSTVSSSSTRRIAHTRSRSHTSAEPFHRSEIRRELEIVREQPQQTQPDADNPGTDEPSSQPG